MNFAHRQQHMPPVYHLALSMVFVTLLSCVWASPLLAVTERPVSNDADLRTALTNATSGDKIKLTNNISGGGSYTLSADGVILEGNGHTLGATTANKPSITLDTNIKDTTIQNITFKGHTSTEGKGGAMLLTGTNLTMTNVVFDSNVSQSPTKNGELGGGAIRIEGLANSSLAGTKFINNKTTLNPALPAGHYSASGGAVHVLSTITNVSFENTMFSGNYAANMGGAIYVLTGLRQVNFNNALFENNTSEVEGGAMFLRHARDTTFHNATFSGNTSLGSMGGAVLLYSPENVDFTGAKFIGNKTEGGSTDGLGGAVYIGGGSNVIFRQALFDGNSGVMGGAAYLTEFSAPLNTVDFTGAAFKNNAALTSGGALYIKPDVNDVILNDVSFTNNSARRGGAIYTDTNLTIGGDSLFSGNTAATTGGAIMMSGANILTLNPGQNQTVEFATATDTIEGIGSMFKTGKGTAKFGGNVALRGNIEVREGEMIVTGDAIISAKDFLLKRDAVLGMTLSALNNAIIRLDSGKGVMESGSTFKAKLMGDAANLQAGQSVDVAVLSGATGSSAADFDPTIAIDNLLFTASGKFANDTWYVTLTRHSIVDPPVPPDPPDIIDPPVPPIPPIPPVTPPIPPDIGGSVDDDYKPGDNPWLDDVLEGKPEEVPRAVLSGVTLPSLVQTFFILQDLSGVMRNASFQGPEWARRNGGKIWGDERGSLWAAPFYLRDKTRNMSTRYGYKTGYDLHLGGGIAGINRNAADDTATFGGLVALGAGRLTSRGDFLRTSNATQFFASSVYGEWRPEAMKGALRLGVRGGITSTENTMYQAGPAPLRAKIYARAWQLDLYAEHRKVWDEWEMRTSVGAGAVWYYRPSFNAKSPSHSLDPAEASRDVDVAEYGQSRELTVRIPVRVTVSRRIATDSGTVTPEVYVGYQPVLGDRSEDYTWKLMNGTHPVKVYGPQLDRHTATAGASIVWQKENIRAALSWDAEFSRHRRSHAIGLSFAWEF